MIKLSFEQKIELLKLAGRMDDLRARLAKNPTKVVNRPGQAPTTVGQKLQEMENSSTPALPDRDWFKDAPPPGPPPGSKQSGGLLSGIAGSLLPMAAIQGISLLSTGGGDEATKYRRGYYM